MRDNKTKGNGMEKAADRNRGDNQSAGGAPAPAGVSAPSRPSGASAFHIYKPGQGAYVRWGTAAAGGIVVLGFAAFLQEQLTRFDNEWVEYLIPAALLVVLGYGVFRLLGQNRSTVDFMIATEGEMKKVNWSTRREVLGATKVVIATVIALGTILFLVNIVFMFIFELIGVLRVNMISQIFRVGAE
jgi:preprotein translocase SecE subunit